MYTAKPPPPLTHLGTSTRMPTLRQPWWAILEGERMQMHAFTRPSQQLRQEVRHALLRSLHYTSLYRRLILKIIEVGTNTQTIGKAIYRRLTANPWEGTTLLMFVYGQQYNGKLAKRCGHVPTDTCPLCHKPDSCNHIAGECFYHKALTISRHNAACQLVHTSFRKSAKEGPSSTVPRT
jgi:hypothetical protein